ncbi:hypothetical protein PoB_006127500 [Plakobranchus ocellatus]|uniref:Sema domain-containing protein n=1 Tax=Plakobranchus ocellatus TaxID=259542 RepID=A0AAV4CS67_9GAST|nr:hypothetical protein PoB_006127500 [Plakobranchus ocellatus]
MQAGRQVDSLAFLEHSHFPTGRVTDLSQKSVQFPTRKRYSNSAVYYNTQVFDLQSRRGYGTIITIVYAADASRSGHLFVGKKKDDR